MAGGKGKAEKTGKAELARLARDLAALCLRERGPDSTRAMVALLGERAGAEASPELLAGLFIASLARALLLQANAIYRYPYGEGVIYRELLPCWLHHLERLERPIALRDAFYAYYREGLYFPLPAQILPLLPANAIRPLRPAPETGDRRATPGLGRAIYERVKRRNFKPLPGQLPLPGLGGKERWRG